MVLAEEVVEVEEVAVEVKVEVVVVDMVGSPPRGYLAFALRPLPGPPPPLLGLLQRLQVRRRLHLRPGLLQVGCGVRHGSTPMDLLVSTGLSWSLLVSPGLSWTLLDPPGLYWTDPSGGLEDLSPGSRGPLSWF